MGCPRKIPRLRPNRPFGSAIPAALSIEYVIKNKGEVTPTVVGRLSDVEQTYGVGSIRYCFAPIAVIGRVQSPRLLSTLSRPSPSGTQTAKSCGYRTFHGDGATLR